MSHPAPGWPASCQRPVECLGLEQTITHRFAGDAAYAAVTIAKKTIVGIHTAVFGPRALVDTSAERVQTKSRNARTPRTPYMPAIGNGEAANRTAAVRLRNARISGDFSWQRSLLALHRDHRASRRRERVVGPVSFPHDHVRRAESHRARASRPDDQLTATGSWPPVVGVRRSFSTRLAEF